MALIENIQRSDLNVIEEARAYKSLIDEFGYTQETVGKRVGKERSTVSNTLRMLNLPVEIQEDLIAGAITAGHARALLFLRERAQMLSIRDQILKRELSVRETESLCRGLRSGIKSNPEKKQSTNQDPDLHYIQEDLQSILGLKVEIFGSNKRGRIELNYLTPEDFEDLVNRLKKSKMPAH